MDVISTADGWTAMEAAMDAVVRADYRDVHARRYRRLPPVVVECIERQHGVGMPLEAIAGLLNRYGHRPLARREASWTPFMVRIVLAVVADPELRAELVQPARSSAA